MIIKKKLNINVKKECLFDGIKKYIVSFLFKLMKLILLFMKN